MLIKDQQRDVLEQRDILDNCYTIRQATKILQENLSRQHKHPAIVFFALVSLEERMGEGSSIPKLLQIVANSRSLDPKVRDAARSILPRTDSVKKPRLKH